MRAAKTLENVKREYGETGAESESPLLSPGKKEESISTDLIKEEEEVPFQIYVKKEIQKSYTEGVLRVAESHTDGRSQKKINGLDGKIR